MVNILKRIEKYTLYLTLFFFPLIVLPLFTNPFNTPKVTLLAFGVGFALLIKAVNTLVKGQLNFDVGKFDIGVFLLAAAYVISALLRAPNKMEAFFLPGTATVVASSAFLYFLINTYKGKEKQGFTLTLFLSALFVSLINLLAFSGMLTKIPQLPVFVKNTLFNTIGGHLPTVVFAATLVPLGIGFLVKEKDFFKKGFWAASLLVILLGIGISIYTIMPGKETAPRLPSFATSWSIAVDSLKESPFLGVGPANYLTAFNRFLPISYNQTDLWNVRFSSARSFYLTVLTETGLVGALGIILILLGIYRYTVPNKEKLVSFKDAKATCIFSLILLLASFIAFSASHMALVLLFVLLALGQETKTISLNLSAYGTDSPIASRIPAILVSVPVIAALLVFGYYGSRALRAEAVFKRSIDALTKNEGETTYNLMAQAITLNPYVDRYHASYTQINLALAQNIAQSEDLTDEQRETITQLIQQAIREAKAVVTLNPQRAGNWQLLAQTYRSILAFAEGADTFAIQSFNQAIALDPINPSLRIGLGGLHYALGQYDDAIRAFELATFAKPDLANGHYNLAVALREKGEIKKAINEMTIVLSLVDRDSQDFEFAKRELENLEEQKGEEVEAAGATLTPPQEQEQIIKPPLELPEGAEPPEEVVKPSPSPAPQQ